MKARKTILLTAACSLALLGSAIGAVTYAKFVHEKTITQDVGMQRYLFLNVTNWHPNNVETDYYIYLFNLKAEGDYRDPAAKQWYKGRLYGGEIYWFYVPRKYDYAIFVRANPQSSYADVSNCWATGGSAIWTQTADIALGKTSEADNYFKPIIDNGAAIPDDADHHAAKTLAQIDAIANPNP